MRKILAILVVSILMFSAVSAAANIDISGQFQYGYTSLERNLVKGSFGLIGDNDDSKVVITVNKGEDVWFAAKYELNSTTGFTDFYVGYSLVDYPVFNMFDKAYATLGVQDAKTFKLYEKTIVRSGLRDHLEQYTDGVKGVQYHLEKGPLSIAGGVYNSGTTPVFNTPAYSLQIVYDFTNMVGVDYLEGGLALVQNTPSDPAYGIFTKLETMGFAFDVTYLFAYNYTVGTTVNNFSDILVGVSYKLFSNLDLMARYERPTLKATAGGTTTTYDMKNIVVGVAWEYAENLAFHAEVVLPTYDNSSVNDDSYYVLAAKYVF